MSKTLALKFKLASGDTRTFSFSCPKDELTESEARTAMTAIVDAGNTFDDAPVKAISATLTEKEETVIYENTD